MMYNEKMSPETERLVHALPPIEEQAGTNQCEAVRGATVFLNARLMLGLAALRPIGRPYDSGNTRNVSFLFPTLGEIIYISHLDIYKTYVDDERYVARRHISDYSIYVIAPDSPYKKAGFEFMKHGNDFDSHITLETVRPGTNDTIDAMFTTKDGGWILSRIIDGAKPEGSVDGRVVPLSKPTPDDYAALGDIKNLLMESLDTIATYHP